jgi:4-hydroxy-tetrahydrodipicolinate reductase
MIKVGLMGFGKTGKEVARELLSTKAVKLVCVFKYHDDYLVNQEIGPILGMEATGVTMSLCEDYEEVLNKTKPDVVIDFAAKRNIMHYLEATARCGVNLVICSTGYNEDQLNMLRSYSDEIGIVCAPNITDGINVLLQCCKMVKAGWPEADMSIIETHHSGKKDISGTAFKLAQRVRDTEHIKIGRTIDNAREENEIIIHKVRLGGIIGQHQVIFGDPYQTITLTHNTISRGAFGMGAIRAARWIHRKKGFFNMDDVIGLKKTYRP